MKLAILMFGLVATLGTSLVTASMAQAQHDGRDKGQGWQQHPNQQPQNNDRGDNRGFDRGGNRGDNRGDNRGSDRGDNRGDNRWGPRPFPGYYPPPPPPPVYPPQYPPQNPYGGFECLRVSQKGELALGRGRDMAEAGRDAEVGARYAQAEAYICGPVSYRQVTCELVKTESGQRFYGQGDSEATASMQAFQNCGDCYRYAHVRRCY